GGGEKRAGWRRAASRTRDNSGFPSCPLATRVAASSTAAAASARFIAAIIIFRIRGAVLDLGPMRQRRDVLEALEVDAFVLARGPAGLEVGERVLDRARDAEDERGRIGHHGEAQAVELARRQHRRAPAAFHHVRELRHALKRPPTWVSSSIVCGASMNSPSAPALI